MSRSPDPVWYSPCRWNAQRTTLCRLPPSRRACPSANSWVPVSASISALAKTLAVRAGVTGGIPPRAGWHARSGRPRSVLPPACARGRECRSGARHRPQSPDIAGRGSRRGVARPGSRRDRGRRDSVAGHHRDFRASSSHARRPGRAGAGAKPRKETSSRANRRAHRPSSAPSGSHMIAASASPTLCANRNSRSLVLAASSTCANSCQIQRMSGCRTQRIGGVVRQVA